MLYLLRTIESPGHGHRADSTTILVRGVRFETEKKALLALGVTVAVGLTWNSVQQWVAYFETGVVNDIVLVAASTFMDLAGGAVSYILFHLNILKKWLRLTQSARRCPGLDPIPKLFLDRP